MYRTYYDSPIGRLWIEADEEALTALYPEQKEIAEESETESSVLLDKVKRELAEYFAGTRTEFDIPVRLQGTKFQVAVWRALCRIPYGTTYSYLDLAKAVGNPKACRAVGGANNKNKILIIVPCHRVIGKDGSLVDFGAGLTAKKYLLELEKKYS